MSNCQSCGRDDGHYLGCAEAQGPWADMGGDIHLPPADSRVCVVGDCARPVRSEDKRVKYCTEHSDPKNRK